MELASALIHGWKKQSLLGERSVEYEVIFKYLENAVMGKTCCYFQ